MSIFFFNALLLFSGGLTKKGLSWVLKMGGFLGVVSQRALGKERGAVFDIEKMMETLVGVRSSSTSLILFLLQVSEY